MNAVLTAGADDVVDAVARAQAVTKVRPSPDFESISVAFKRMKNILRQATESGKQSLTLRILLHCRSPLKKNWPRTFQKPQKP